MEKVISPFSDKTILKSPSLYFITLLIRLENTRDKAERSSIHITFVSDICISGMSWFYVPFLAKAALAANKKVPSLFLEGGYPELAL